MGWRNRQLYGRVASIIVGLAVFSWLTASASAVRDGSSMQGAVEVTLSPDQLYGFVTVCESPGGVPKAAFILQLARKPQSASELRGQGRVTQSNGNLRIKFANHTLLFAFPDNTASMMADGAVPVMGIARYTGTSLENVGQPKSHSDFVSQMSSVLGPPGPCDYSLCSCDGGKGAQSCTCDGRQVSCYAPYEACCGGGRAFCCTPS